MEQLGHRHSGLVGVVVNYYNPSGNDSLYYQTLLCGASYKENDDCIVCISDGSGSYDARLASASQSAGLVYVHSTSKLGFAEGYNQGIDYFMDIAEVEYIILSANDIIASKYCVSEMLECFAGSKNAGCVTPYLSSSDYFIQCSKFKYRTRVVPVMTLNCNLFLKQDLLDIGRVPQYLSGYFNDVVMAERLFALGKRIYLPKGITLTHLVSRTIAVSSSARYDLDRQVFFDRHRDLCHSGDFCIRAEKFSNSRFELFFSFLNGLSYSGLYRRLVGGIYRFVFDLEAFLYNVAVAVVPGSLVKRIRKG